MLLLYTFCFARTCLNVTLIFTSKSFDTGNKLFRFNFICTIKTNFLLVMRHFGQSLKRDNFILPR